MEIRIVSRGERRARLVENNQPRQSTVLDEFSAVLVGSRERCERSRYVKGNLAGRGRIARDFGRAIADRARSRKETFDESTCREPVRLLMVGLCFRDSSRKRERCRILLRFVC
jgi:hypothetical protein